MCKSSVVRQHNHLTLFSQCFFLFIFFFYRLNFLLVCQSVFVILSRQESVVACDSTAIIPMNESDCYEGANKSDCKLYYIFILIVSKRH